MASCVIVNNGITAIPLPFPFKGVLKGRQRLIVNMGVGKVVAMLGGEQALGVLSVDSLPDSYTGPYDHDVFLGGYPASTTFREMELWVDAARGDDNAEGTEQAPLATLVEAEKRIPDIISHKVTVHVAAHTGSGYAPPEFRPRLLKESVYFYAEDVNELIAERASQVGTTHTQCVSIAGLGVNTYRGKTIEIMSGDVVNYRRTIKSHTDTAIVPVQCWPSSTIAPGDTFRVFEPSVQIDLENNPLWRVTQGAQNPVNLGFDGDFREVPAIVFVNFLFAGGASHLRVASDQLVRFYGCEVSGSSNLYLIGSFVTAVDQVDFTLLKELSNASEFLAGVDDAAWVGWGLTTEQGVTVLRSTTSHFYGLVAPSLGVYGQGYVGLRGGNIYSGGCEANGYAFNGGEAVLELNGKVYLPDLPLNIDGTNGTYGAVVANGPMARVFVDEVVLTAPALVGAYAYDGGRVDLTAVSITAGTGLKAELGGRVVFGTGMSITATGNEMEAGNTPTTSNLATLNTFGEYIAENDGSVVQRNA